MYQKVPKDWRPPPRPAEAPPSTATPGDRHLPRGQQPCAPDGRRTQRGGLRVFLDQPTNVPRTLHSGRHEGPGVRRSPPSATPNRGAAAPSGPASKYFPGVALTYEEAGPRFTFFQSSRGHCQIMNILRIYYSPSIMHRYAVVQPLHIEELTFGAVACLGTFSATDGWRRSAFIYRGSSLPVVEIDSFYSNVSDWEVIL